MNLVYYTISSDIRYIDFLKKSIDSLILLGKYEEDILIISDNTCFNYVVDIFPKCKFLHLDIISNRYEISSNKLKIGQYKYINNYDKILYLDIDMAIQNNIETIFKLIDDDKILVSNEDSLISSHEYFWGYHLFSDQEKEKYNIFNTKGINGGLLGFKTSSITHIQNILNDIKYDTGIDIHGLCEQPTINKYLISNNIYNPEATNHVLQFASNADYSLHKDKTIIHFCGGVGNYQNKAGPLAQWYENNINKQ